MRCDAVHDGHDCTELGACRRAIAAMCERAGSRHRDERQRDVLDGRLDLSACVKSPTEWRARAVDRMTTWPDSAIESRVAQYPAPDRLGSFQLAVIAEAHRRRLDVTL